MRSALIPLLMLALLPGCASELTRDPLPAELTEAAHPPGFEDVRYWADQTDTSYMREIRREEGSAEARKLEALQGVPHTYLSISGGGPRGAYTAGLLNGWTAAGDRPEFTAVSGVSTGALIAPFAFLGPEYDDQIRSIYTEYSTEDVIKMHSPLKGLFSDAAGDSAPLADRIAEFFTEDIMAQVASEYQRGRYLTMITTNIDLGRPVAWDIGAIASSGHPDALSLIHKIMLASAAVPGAFPPVVFEVDANGQRFDELHVDGGAASVVHLFPMNYDASQIQERFDLPAPPKVYVIRNGQLQLRWKETQRSSVDVVLRTLQSLMNNVVYGDLYRIYLTTQRDGLKFHMTAIPESFDMPQNELFDPEYMRALYDLGYERAAAGYPWQSTPPGYREGRGEE